MPIVPAQAGAQVGEYSPQVFSRTTWKSMSPGFLLGSGHGMPGIRRTGRRFTYSSNSHRNLSSEPNSEISPAIRRARGRRDRSASDRAPPAPERPHPVRRPCLPRATVPKNLQDLAGRQCLPVKERAPLRRLAPGQEEGRKNGQGVWRAVEQPRRNRAALGARWRRHRAAFALGCPAYLGAGTLFAVLPDYAQEANNCGPRPKKGPGNGARTHCRGHSSARLAGAVKSPVIRGAIR
jgi:hypothetical protein